MCASTNGCDTVNRPMKYILSVITEVFIIAFPVLGVSESPSYENITAWIVVSIGVCLIVKTWDFKWPIRFTKGSLHKPDFNIEHSARSLLSDQRRWGCISGTFANITMASFTNMQRFAKPVELRAWLISIYGSDWSQVVDHYILHNIIGCHHLTMPSSH